MISTGEDERRHTTLMSSAVIFIKLT